MKKKRQAVREAGKSAAATVDATAASPPAPATRGPHAAPPEGGAKAPASLLDTIEPNTSPGELVRLLAMILAFPTVVSLIVKYLVLPYLF